MPERLDWSKLPAELRWLAAPAERYGHYQFHDRIHDFLRGLDAAGRDELRALTRRLEAAHPEIEAWLDRFNMTVHREATLVYFAQALIGTGWDDGFL